MYIAIHYLYNLYNTPLDRPFPSVDRCSSSQGFGIEAGLYCNEECTVLARAKFNEAISTTP